MRLKASVWVVAALVVWMGVRPGSLPGQRLQYVAKPDARRGEVIYKNGCIACHGADGKGADPKYTVFQRPDTWPDFTRCDQTTPEANSAWKAVIVHGGKSRAFSQIMPAFGDLLTDAEINDVLWYMRAFCKNEHHYPLGELNLPRALVTEKAFPEDELVQSTFFAATGAPSWTTDIIREKTWAGRNQLEVDIPVNYADMDHNWTAGVGDITVGLKRELLSSLRTGSILSVQGGVIVPTGDPSRGFGSGSTTFEPFAAYDQLFPKNFFVQTQVGADLPVDTSIAPRSMYFRAALGQALAPDHRLGRLFTPMFEFLGSRDFEQGASTNWDVLPQMQVTVSRRQHIRADIGVRTPITNTGGRTPQVAFYMLWDMADGKLWKGWR